ncbi:MAG: hypothetical protein WKF89_04910 [Chitinophagaceae bacterium]
MSLWLPLEKENGNFENVIDQQIKGSQKAGKSTYRSVEIPFDHTYRIALYLESLHREMRFGWMISM